MPSAEVTGTAPYYFELPTGVLYTSEACIEAVEAEKTPRNLWQLLSAGRFTVAGTVICERANSSASDVRPLQELIDDEQTSITSGIYRALEVSDWTDDEHVVAGRWLAAIMSRDGELAPLRSRYIKQANYLGLFASLRVITSPCRFGNLAYFNRSLGAIPIYTKHEHAEWTAERHADHVEQVFLSKRNEETLHEALWARARADKGPSPEVIARHIRRIANKTIMQLLQERGYFIGPMERQAYIDWGVRTMLVNDGISITRAKVIEPLRKRNKRAPSVRPLKSHFGSITNFKYTVREEHDMKLERIEKDIANTLLPASLFEDQCTNYERVRRAAQYRLINQLGLQMEDWHKNVAAGAPSSKAFIATVRQHSPHISEDRIKEVARQCELYDDIWTLEEAREYLRVE